jgi:hypothetical protein
MSPLKHTPRSKYIIIVVSIFIFIIGSGLIYIQLNKDNTNNSPLSIEDGLTPIKIIQTVDGKEQEVNFTQATFKILEKTLKSNDSFELEALKALESIQISKIIFPPIPETYIKTINSNNPQSDIENYLKEVYTIFKDNTIQPNINQLVDEALSQNTTNIQSQLQTNSALYENLFKISIPQDALSLHKKYIQIAQIQNNFLVGLLSAEQDPLKIQINTKLTLTLLDQINMPIKQDLQTLREKYNITYQK